MKKLKVFCCTIGLLMGIGAFAGNPYTISGVWEGGDGRVVYLQKQTGEKTYDTIDSVIVQNGVFALEGQLPEIDVRTLTIAGKSTNIILCGEPVLVSVTDKITPKGKTVIDVNITGGREQKVLDEATRLETAKGFMELGITFMIVQNKDHPEKLDSLLKVREAINIEQLNRIKVFISDNNDTYAITWFISDFIAKSYPISDTEAYYAQLTSRVKNAYPGRLLAQKMQHLRQINSGGIAPDISLPTPDGTIVALSSLRGQYVLIDFWASWCKPCLREVPNVKEVYAKYHDKGFEVYGISLDDEKQRAAWLAAIERHDMPWIQVSSLKGWDCPVAKQYQVTGIPKTLLLDREGRIIATDLRGDNLKNKIETLFQ
ncbi:MAG: AhpC/TSA family protein [Dysgonamonadaceae bacterium]|jgi:peroxiredoxin|nr:AhpC/TSA family protein [Dysgonamonadaceae bacterium]